MAIWFHENIRINDVNSVGMGTMINHIGIVVTAIGEDFLEATMPVDHRTKQPAGLLHGGASLALVETLGSVGAFLTIDPARKSVAGIEINANHLRSIREGSVRGVGRPLHIGSRTQVWEVKIFNDEEVLLCVGRITLAILDKK